MTVAIKWPKDLSPQQDMSTMTAALASAASAGVDLRSGYR